MMYQMSRLNVYIKEMPNGIFQRKHFLNFVELRRAGSFDKAQPSILTLTGSRAP